MQSGFFFFRELICLVATLYQKGRSCGSARHILLKLNGTVLGCVLGENPLLGLFTDKTDFSLLHLSQIRDHFIGISRQQDLFPRSEKRIEALPSVGNDGSPATGSLEKADRG